MADQFVTLYTDDNLMLEKLETTPFGTNAYVLNCLQSNRCLLFDAPGNSVEILEHLAGKEVLYIIITHGHMDHIMALEEIYEGLGAKVAAHENDADGLPLKADRLLSDGEIIACGSLEVKVIHTPGHTAGSLCFRVGHLLIAGDTIFPGGPGKTDSPASFNTLLDSIKEKILTLPDQTRIFSGHGLPTTVGEEKKQIEAFLARGYGGNLYGDVTWQE